MSAPQERLGAVLGRFARLAVAVSGGVDSTTLAWFAHRRLGDAARMFHAVSPAVPPEATERVRDLARAEGWALEIVDAREFDDPAYLANPVDRCFFCKRDLYGTIARATSDTIASGTNLDDLGDFRPGLRAAADRGVVHPYVEAAIDKTGVRELARTAALAEIAELPAAPCLSSRIETGLPVTIGRLAFVLEAERAMAHLAGPGVLRCRVRHDGIELQLGAEETARLGAAAETLRDRVAELAAAHDVPGPVRIAPYARGSAFIQPAA